MTGACPARARTMTKTANPPPDLVRLKTRAEFLRAARGRRCAMPGLVLQCRAVDGNGAVRVGFTATKKLGGAVTRNRVKRRLRAAAAALLPEAGRPGHAYVLIGRAATATRPYRALLNDLRTALKRVHAPPRRDRREDRS